MQRALRPYAAAGVALATAGVIAAAPAISPPISPPTQIQSHAVQLTALDDPIAVFAPVFDQIGAVIQNAVQAELDTPLPVVNAVIGKVAADAQTLGGLANAVAQSFATIGTNLPPALQTAFQSLAAGDFNGYVAAFTPVFMGPLLTFQTNYFKLLDWVEDQFVLAGAVTRHVLIRANGLTIGQALNLLTPINAITNTLTQLAQVAIPSGDPAQIVNTIQHGIANIAIGALTFADRWRASLDSTRVRLGAIINPPSPAAAFSPGATPSPAILGPAATPFSQAPIITAESPSLDDESASMPEEKAGATTVVVKPKAKPSTTAVSHTDARTAVTRGTAKNLSAGIKKATDGLKKAAESLGGKKAEKPSSDSENAAE